VTLVDNRNTSDPYLNLAIEEYLVREVDCKEDDLVLLYINEPCLVVGKNQSIYKEVNFEYLRNGKLKLCRRISGGGTVYHDRGNLSFSFISKFSEQKINNYKLFNQPVVDALQKAGVNAEMDNRNNILCKGKKISGNAQFTNRKNIISHGTLLFDADLDVLRNCLKENDFKVESRAVGSVRSSVMNIKGLTGDISTAEELKSYLQKELKAEKVLSFTPEQWKEIELSSREKFKSFEWIYGRSPSTTVTKGEIEIKIDDGVIREIKRATDLIATELTGLIGTKYEYAEVKKALSGYPNAADLLEAVF
jgi:lipoate-protein ligase A